MALSCAGEIVQLALPMHNELTRAVVLAAELQLLLLLNVPHAPVGVPKSANLTIAIVLPAASQLSVTGPSSAADCPAEPPQNGL